MDEKEYQPGVWYGADVKPPAGTTAIVVHEIKADNDYSTDVYDLSVWFDSEHSWIQPFERVLANRAMGFREEEKMNVKYWMLIPESPKE